MVNVKDAGEKYRCSICGNEVEVTKAGGGELVCCGQPMQLITGEAVPAPELAPEAGEGALTEGPASGSSEEEKQQTF